MTQVFDRIPDTNPFVDAKNAIQDVLKLGYRDYGHLGVIDYKVRVLKADPLQPAALPAIAINRIGDSEINQVLNDYFGEENDPDHGSIVRKYGTDFRETIECAIWTVNSDQRDLLYQLTKAILFNYRHYLALKYGLVNQSIIGGRDDANHVQFEGHALYRGVVIFQAENSIQRNVRLPKLTEVNLRGYFQPSVVESNTEDI